MTVRWKKSSRSGNATDCVEVANNLGAVRDSKNPEVVLGVAPARLEGFLRSLKTR